MSELEKYVKSQVMIEVSKIDGVRVFNNPVGVGWNGRLVDQANGITSLRFASRITYGLFPGSSDLIGWRSMVITPDMVGRRIAVFTAIETKRERGGVESAKQENFREQVLLAGGIADVINHPDDAVRLITSFRGGEP